MYTFPDNFDPSIFKNKELEQVCFSISTISLHFGLEDYIRIEGEYILTKNGKDNVYAVYPLTRDNGILQLLSCTINEICINEKRTNLKITFSNNVELTLIGNEMYESYFIKIGSIEILV